MTIVNPPTAGTPVDPVLAKRVRAAAERITGLPVRLTRGRLEVLLDRKSVV